MSKTANHVVSESTLLSQTEVTRMALTLDYIEKSSCRIEVRNAASQLYVWRKFSGVNTPYGKYTMYSGSDGYYSLSGDISVSTLEGLISAGESYANSNLSNYQAKMYTYYNLSGGELQSQPLVRFDIVAKGKIKIIKQPSY